MGGLWISVRQYVRALGVAGWVLIGVAGTAGTVLWLVERLSPQFYTDHFSTWAWWVRPTLLFIVLGIAPFLAFHHQRIEFDKLLRENTALKQSTPEIQGIALFMHRSRRNMFDLRVVVLVHNETAFRDEWELDVVLANGDLVGGMRGIIAEHSLSRIGTYALTVSFPFGRRIPDLASLATASVSRLSATDAQSRRVSYPRSHAPAVPLVPWQEEEPYPVGTPITPILPGIAVETRKEFRRDIPHEAGYVPCLWGLTIRNDGAAAEFQASVKLISGATTHLPEGRAHRLSFRDGLRAKIVTGAEDYLFFGLVVWNGLYDGVISKALWYFAETVKREEWADLIGVSGEPGSKVVADLEVTIVSEPSMDAPWKRHYRLGPGNELQDATPSETSTN